MNYNIEYLKLAIKLITAGYGNTELKDEKLIPEIKRLTLELKNLMEQPK